MRDNRMLLFFALATLAFMIPMGRWNTDIRERYDFAFHDLQDAQSVERAQRILDRWKPDAVREEIEKTMKLDLAFPFAYAPLLALIAWRVSRKAKRGWLRKLGIAVAIGAFAGGVCDLLENTTMLQMLDDGDAAKIATVQLFALPKGLFLMFGTLYGLFAQFEP